MAWWQGGLIGCKPCKPCSDENAVVSGKEEVVELWPTSKDSPRAPIRAESRGPSENLPWVADNWTREVDPMRFEGQWISPSYPGFIHKISGTSLSIGSGPVTTINYCGAQLQLMFNGKGMFAFLDDTNSKLQWSDGEVWERSLDKPAVEPDDPTNFRGSWTSSSAPDCVCSITESSITLWDGSISPITFRDARMEVRYNGMVMSAFLDDSKEKMQWTHNGDIWTRRRAGSDFLGMWTDGRSLETYIVSDTTLRWSQQNNHLSQITFSGGQMQVPDLKLVGTIDASKSEIRWSDGDVWFRPQVAAGDAAGYEGAWKDGESRIFVLANMATAAPTLTMSTGSTTPVTLSAAGVQMTSAGKPTTGALDASKNNLLWSDGQRWGRAGVTGHWNKPGFDGSWGLDGKALTVLMTSGQTWSYPAEMLSPTNVHINIEGKTVMGSVDKAAMVLTWSNNDVWNRALICNTTFSRGG